MIFNTSTEEQSRIPGYASLMLTNRVEESLVLIISSLAVRDQGAYDLMDLYAASATSPETRIKIVDEMKETIKDYQQ